LKYQLQPRFACFRNLGHTFTSRRLTKAGI
jgi:hypothetical protein